MTTMKVMTTVVKRIKIYLQVSFHIFCSITIISFETCTFCVGKRSSQSKKPEKKRARRDDDDGEEKVKIVPEDFGDIDASNILPRASRRAALASGLMNSSTVSKASKVSSSAVNGKSKIVSKVSRDDDSDDEAEF